ncbi:cation:proton antiporter, partial [Bacteroidales bacterium OttesenSCG-928-I14]|nr:cation:proton antiporter [Bacteroidales bacterium OttesenSCG-928-I14]
TKPVKDLFGAIFFVSVGMMIDPKAMTEYGWIILLVTVLVVVGKIISTTVGAILSGQSLRQSIQVGMSMAQIGEFAFIVATLGMTLGVISDFLFPIAVGVSAITTFTTPYLIKYSDNFYYFLEKRLPKKLLKAIDNYTTSTKTIQAENEWKHFVKSYWLIALNNFIILLALILGGLHFLQPFLLKFISNTALVNVITLVAVMLLSSPFIWALMFKMPKNMKYKDLWVSKEYKNGPLLSMGFGRVFIGLCLVGYFVHKLFLTWTSAMIVFVIVIVGVVLASRYLLRVYTKFEQRFMTNLNSREIQEASSNTNIIKKELMSHGKHSSWDINLVDLGVSQEAEYVGNSIESLPWREDYGINIVYIKRGENLIYAPGPDERLLPFDHIGIIASDDDLEKFMPVFDKKVNIKHIDSDVEDIVIEKLCIDVESPLNGKEIKESGIREMSNGLVVGIERGDEQFMNPGPNTVLQTNDIVWIVGERKELQLLHRR